VRRLRIRWQCFPGQSHEPEIIGTEQEGGRVPDRERRDQTPRSTGVRVETSATRPEVARTRPVLALISLTNRPLLSPACDGPAK
jgi:hypothetical protein